MIIPRRQWVAWIPRLELLPQVLLPQVLLPLELFLLELLLLELFLLVGLFPYRGIDYHRTRPVTVK